VLALTDTQTVALIAAGSALAGSVFTGTVQYLIEQYRRSEDRKDRKTERDEDRSDSERERRRDLYQRLLRVVRQVPNDINEYAGDAARAGQFLIDYGRTRATAPCGTRSRA
jgi:hypothetical protein